MAFRRRIGPALGRGRRSSVPVRAGPDALVAIFALNFRQRRVDGSREARVVELGREVVAVGLVGALLPGGAEPDIAGVDALVRPLIGGVFDAGDACLDVEGQCADRAGEAVFVEVKVPMVAMSKSLFAVLGRAFAASMAVAKTGEDRTAPKGPE